MAFVYERLVRSSEIDFKILYLIITIKIFLEFILRLKQAVSDSTDEQNGRNDLYLTILNYTVSVVS